MKKFALTKRLPIFGNLMESLTPQEKKVFETKKLSVIERETIQKDYDNLMNLSESLTPGSKELNELYIKALDLYRNLNEGNDPDWFNFVFIEKTPEPKRISEKKAPHPLNLEKFRNLVMKSVSEAKLDGEVNYGQMVLDSVAELGGKKEISLSDIQKQAKEGVLAKEFNPAEVKELKRLYKEQGVELKEGKKFKSVAEAFKPFDEDDRMAFQGAAPDAEIWDGFLISKDNYNLMAIYSPKEDCLSLIDVDGNEVKIEDVTSKKAESIITELNSDINNFEIKDETDLCKYLSSKEITFDCVTFDCPNLDESASSVDINQAYAEYKDLLGKPNGQYASSKIRQKYGEETEKQVIEMAKKEKSKPTNESKKSISDVSLNLDDVTKDKEHGDWTQLCKEHAEVAKKSKLGSLSPEGEGSGICGVVGCKNESDYYFNFNKNIGESLSVKEFINILADTPIEKLKEVYKTLVGLDAPYSNAKSLLFDLFSSISGDKEKMKTALAVADTSTNVDEKKKVILTSAKTFIKESRDKKLRGKFLLESASDYISKNSYEDNNKTTVEDFMKWYPTVQLKEGESWGVTSTSSDTFKIDKIENGIVYYNCKTESLRKELKAAVEDQTVVVEDEPVV
jgi:hypothetical protein